MTEVTGACGMNDNPTRSRKLTGRKCFGSLVNSDEVAVCGENLLGRVTLHTRHMVVYVSRISMTVLMLLTSCC